MSNADTNVVVHLSPSWRSKANFLLFGAIDLEGEERWEQLWARQVAENEFELCCVPFFLYDLSLGDVVETETREGRRFVISSRVKASGLHTVRAWYSADASEDDKERFLELLRDSAVAMEWHSKRLLAFACVSAEVNRFVDFLGKEQESGVLKFELAN